MTLWDKIKTWLAGAAHAAEVELSNDEKALMALIRPLFGQAEAAALQSLVHFITGAVTAVGTSRTLADWESAILNGLGAAESELLPLARGLGSDLLQALIGLVLGRLRAAPAPVQTLAI
jgi:hypothetical protein